MSDQEDPGGVADILESVDMTLVNYQNTTNYTQDKRYAALEKMEPQLDTVTSISENDKASDIEAKMNAVNTYMSILDRIDKSAHTKATTFMKKKESEAREEDGKQVIEVLKQLAGKPDPFTDEAANNIPQASSDVETRANDEGIVVAETELRADPDDLS